MNDLQTHVQTEDQPQAAEGLTDIYRRLEEAQSQRMQAERELACIRAEQGLRDQLVTAGVVDVELALTALRQQEQDDTPADKRIAGLKRDKPFLFEAAPTPAALPATRGTKDKPLPAKRPKPASGNRKDLLDYMRTKRKK